ncbi:transglycosylase SLT domain-containing protein [uncultured Thiothrix sp.]|uniref:transglycosylase SLT domain-containing protein n=1 Tax=uncultured Thiothrix sp. TaxID=223185 RepID=UPI00261A3EB7|nr:transglycosylase SLT domain-containing protein [uncultured Thiothrix sp.]
MSLLSKSSLATALILLSLSVMPSLSAAAGANWQKALPAPTKPSLSNVAAYQHDLFQYFLSHSLSGKGKQSFQKVSKRVANNITWRDSKGSNAYLRAYANSYAFIKKVDLQQMPATILLIPYLESQWHGTSGTPSGDYGYWQMVPEVVNEIRTLEHAPSAIKKSSANTIRSKATLSTQAAQLHLRRYYFYFAKVAKYSESDSWLLTITAYNWGAGNVKRLMEELKAKGIKPNYANFYHALYKKQQANPSDISLRAAVEYVPSLWHIAQMIDDTY